MSPDTEASNDAGPGEASLVIGVGASLAEHDVLRGFFAGLDSGIRAAIIVCLLSHDEAEDESVVAEIAALCGRTVQLATDGASVNSGSLYLVPSRAIVTVEEGRFRSRSAGDNAADHGRIDSLLVSIAVEYEEFSIAVVLLGTSGDGTLGSTLIKESGGLTLAQLPEGGVADPSSRTASAIVDHLLPIADMGRYIADYERHLDTIQASGIRQSVRKQLAGQLGRIATVLRNKTGHDFHGYKHNTFLRRAQRRMQVTQYDDIESYIEFLRNDPEEVLHLFNDMLIGVTQFFRDRAEFEFLERHIVPKLFADKTASDSVRVWVLGCASGEEAYSIAILLREYMSSLEAVPQVQIFATDIDGRALAAARVGRYPATLANDMSPERLTRWFIREGDTYSIVKELREMCVFSQHSVIKDAPFSRLDLVSCRNLLIYLNAELQNRVIPLFHFALRPDGYLFLGNSENVTRQSKLFAPVDRAFRIFRKLGGAGRILPDFPLSASIDRRVFDPVTTARARSKESDLIRQAERIADRYAPVYVVVDKNYEVVHFSGRTGRFLEPSKGAATLNLLNLVHQDLRLNLRAALYKAEREKQPIRLPPLSMQVEGAAVRVVITVEPLAGKVDEPQNFIVFFQSGDRDEQDVASLPASGPQFPDDHVQRLESDLRLTRERLHSTIEELETANEELKSSNEEYQSINEEMQSANEELETSKEELQSVNEEMQTVNGELASRVQDLAIANSDLKNLLESTQIATVFLDNELRIKNFTPAVADIFHVIDHDLGRPITHIAGRIPYSELQDDVRKVQRTLATIEREVEDAQTGSRFLIRVLPYRSIDNFIAGVVLTFLDITAPARAERALRESEERFRMTAQTVPALLFTARPDLRWDYINSRFYEYTGMTELGGLGHGWLAAVHADDVDENQRLWEASARTGQPFEMEFRLRHASGAYRWFMGRAEPTRTESGDIVKWYGSCTDIHERRLSENRQRLLMAELQHRVRNILGIVRSIFSRTVESADHLEQAAEHFRGRLDALARTQGVLARTTEGGADLEQMVLDELTSHGGRAGEQVSVEGPSVRLIHNAAEAIGLAVHELTTNAVKYGALSVPGGSIRVTWGIMENRAGRSLRWEWREKGVRLSRPFPTQVGFGRELIEQGLPYELDATTSLNFTDDGIHCVIEVPLTDGVMLALSTEDDSATEHSA